MAVLVACTVRNYYSDEFEVVLLYLSVNIVLHNNFNSIWQILLKFKHNDHGHRINVDYKNKIIAFICFKEEVQKCQKYH